MELQQTNIHSHNPIAGATSAAPSEKRRRTPSAKRALTKAQKEQNRGFPLPLYLVCTITNEKVKYTSIAYIRKLLQKHGSIEAIRKNYVSAEGRKKHPTG